MFMLESVGELSDEVLSRGHHCGVMFSSPEHVIYSNKFNSNDFSAWHNHTYDNFAPQISGITWDGLIDTSLQQH